jgi:hypothetical protein
MTVDAVACPMEAGPSIGITGGKLVRTAFSRRLRRVVAFAAAITLAAAVPAAAASDSQSSSHRFDAAFTIPNLGKGYTPQGMTAWSDGHGHSLIILGEYRRGHRSLLVAVDPISSRVFGTVEVALSHLGGIAIVDDWLFAQDHPHPGSEKIRRYKMSDLAAAWNASQAHGGKAYYVRRTGKPQQLAKWQFASFMSSYRGHLFAGHHGRGAGARMYEYAVGRDGWLSALPGWIQVPNLTDGVAVTGDRFVFSSRRGGTGLMTVARRATRLSPITTFDTPGPGEGTTIANGRLYVQFEGGHRYVYATPYQNLANAR